MQIWWWLGLASIALPLVACDTSRAPTDFTGQQWFRATQGANPDAKAIQGVAGVGNVITLSTADGFLYVFDTRHTPRNVSMAQPQFLDETDIAFVNLPAELGSGAITMQGSRAFVVRPNGNLFVVDVSDSAHPVIASSAIATGVLGANYAKTVDSRLFVSNMRGEYAVFDVGQMPPAPVAMGARMDTMLTAAFTGDAVYAIEPGGIALRVWQLDQTAMAVRGGSVTLPGVESSQTRYTAIAATNGYLYTAGASIMAAFTLTDPANPQLISSDPGVFQSLDPAGPTSGPQQMALYDDTFLFAPTVGTYPYDTTQPANLKGRTDLLSDSTQETVVHQAVARHTFAAASDHQVWVGDGVNLVTFGPSP